MLGTQPENWKDVSHWLACYGSTFVTPNDPVYPFVFVEQSTVGVCHRIDPRFGRFGRDASADLETKPILHANSHSADLFHLSVSLVVQKLLVAASWSAIRCPDHLQSVQVLQRLAL